MGQIVDTTCPYVSKVWNSVETHTRRKHTSIIHGKWAHEETIATASFAGDYVIVKNMAEAEYVAELILGRGDHQEFLEKFKNAISDGFDPATMLDKVGIANQTTMLKGETEAIGKLFQKTMLEKHGPAELDQHFVVMDTADRIDAGKNATDWMNSHLEMQRSEGWLPEGKLRIGVTSGASTPDKVVEDILDKVCEIKMRK